VHIHKATIPREIRMRSVRLIAIVLLITLTCTLGLAQSDTEPPMLVGFDFNPKSVDISAGSGTTTCTMIVTDSPAGVDWVQCSFDSPGGQHVYCRANSPSTGDIYNGTFACDVTIPQYSAAGTWVVSVGLGDNVNNNELYDTAELQQMGFPTDLEVTNSNEDLDPPVLVNLDFNPKSVDISTSSGTTTCTMIVTDSPAGVDWVQCSFDSPGGQHVYCRADSPSTGDIYNGTFACDVTIPQYSEEGPWVVSVGFEDNVNNHAFYDTAALQQIGFPISLNVGFVEGYPRARVTAPQDGKRIRGSSVTVQAGLIQGSPDDVHPTLGVRFSYRSLPLGDFVPITAGNANHPNPDTTYPYYAHWDVSSIPNGDYALTVVAHDLTEQPDPTPETITITIDHEGPVDVDENVNAEGHQESQTAVDNTRDTAASSGNHTDASTATEVSLPAGCLTFTTDTADLLYADPASEEGSLEQPEQSIGAFVGISLQSGQTDLEGGLLGNLNISYADANQDGVVDGTNILEEDLTLRRYDDSSGSYLVVSATVLTEHNIVHADVSSLGKYALAGLLQPRIRLEADKQSVTWDTVSTALSYNVYRGDLFALMDGDSDGLPDSGYGDCQNHFDPDVTDTVFLDSDVPTEGTGYFYIAAFVDSLGEARLGNTSKGQRRTVVFPCP
jgi:hypothetical protein